MCKWVLVMQSDIPRISLAGTVSPTPMPGGAFLPALLLYRLWAGHRSRVGLARDRLTVAECWGAIDRAGQAHGGREALPDGCRRIARGFQRTCDGRP